MIDSRRSGGMPTSEQIRRAFEKVAIESSGAERVISNGVEGSMNLHASRQPNAARESSQERHLQELPKAVEASFNMASLGVVPGSYGSSNPSWGTIERHEKWGTPSSYEGGDWEGQRSSEERHELPASNSRRNSKRISQLIDVIEEDDGHVGNRFMG
jgi:hypothetical protein